MNSILGVNLYRAGMGLTLLLPVMAASLPGRYYELMDAWLGKVEQGSRRRHREISP